MNWNDQTAKEWDQLGFYYEHDSSLNQWRFFGSKNGLYKLLDIVKSYTSDPLNDQVSEHIHIGPYNYLKVMTWHEPIVTNEYIAGSLKDLLMLSDMLSSQLSVTGIGKICKISSGYSVKSSSAIVLIIMADDFTPSSIEF